MAPIAVGDVIPNGKVSYFDEQDQLQSVSVHSLAKGKKVIIFAVPGAFTPTCRFYFISLGFLMNRASDLWYWSMKCYIQHEACAWIYWKGWRVEVKRRRRNPLHQWYVSFSSIFISLLFLHQEGYLTSFPPGNYG